MKRPLKPYTDKIPEPPHGEPNGEHKEITFCVDCQKPLYVPENIKLFGFDTRKFCRNNQHFDVVVKIAPRITHAPTPGATRSAAVRGALGYSHIFQHKKNNPMPTYIFEEVKLYGSKSGKCSACGKACTRSQKFSQTLSPFNKNKMGEAKTRQEIKAELLEELTLWRSKPPIHSRCE